MGGGNYPHLKVLRSPDVYVQDQDPRYSDVDTCDELSRSNSGYRAVKVVYLDLEHSNASPNILLGAPSFSESDLFHGWHEIDKNSNANLEDVCREVNCPDKEYCGGRHRDTATNYSYFQKNARVPANRVYVSGIEPSARIKDQELMPSSLKEDNEVKEEIPSNEGQEPSSETVIKGEESSSTSPTIQFPDNASLLETSLPHDHQAKTSFVSRGLNLARSQSWDSSLVLESVDKFERKLCTLSSTQVCESPPKNTVNADTKEKANSPDKKEITTISVSCSLFHSNITIHG